MNDVEAVPSQYVVRKGAEPWSVLEHRSNWLPEAPADPELRRRIGKSRWQPLIVEGVIVTVWLAGLIQVMITNGLWIIDLSPLFVLFLILLESLRVNRPGPVLDDLLDFPAIVPQYPVKVVYRVANADYGYDEGIVSLVDEWIHFQGRRSTFSLLHSDVMHQRSERRGQGRTDLQCHLLSYRGAGPLYCVELQPFDQIEGISHGLANRLEWAISNWKACRFEGRGESIWPPRRPMPGLVANLIRASFAWTAFRWCSVALVFTGLRGLLSYDFGHEVSNLFFMMAAIACFTASESKLGRLESSLREIETGCEDGAEEIRAAKEKRLW